MRKYNSIGSLGDPLKGLLTNNTLSISQYDVTDKHKVVYLSTNLEFL